MKSKYCIANIVCLLLSLISCSSNDEDLEFLINNSLKGIDVNEWSININTPDEMKSRADLPDFPLPQNCDKLWYAVYYNNSLLYSSNDTDAPQATQVGDKFTLILKLAEQLDPSKVKIFLWAGHSTDNVVAGSNPTTGDIKLHFGDRYVEVNNTYLNNNKSVVHSYTRYISLSTTATPSSYSLSVTLKRPFASFNIISCQYVTESTNPDYPSGIEITPAFGYTAATETGAQTMLPNRWYYDDSLQTTPIKAKDTYLLTSSLVKYSNPLNKSVEPTINYTIDGVSNEYANLGHFYFFAPSVKGFVSDGTHIYNKLNIKIQSVSDVSKVDFISVDLPESGIQANNKYVVYDKEAPFWVNFTIQPYSNFGDITESQLP